MKSYSRWAVSHGLMRLALKDGARRGDLIARLTVDPHLRANPYDAYEELRAQGALVHGRLVSATVSHAVGNHILRSDDFGVAAGRGGLPGPARRVMERFADPYDVGPVDPPSLLAVDAPDHTRYRKLVAKAFTARSVSGMAESVRRVAEGLLDDLDGVSGFELVDRYASQLPLAVIADLLGFPPEDRPEILRLGNDAAVLLDPGLTWRQYRTAHDAVRRMHARFQEHIDRVRRDPGDDLLSRLAAMEGPDRLTDDELRGVGLLVLGAGFETTVSLIANGVVLLDRHPEQVKLLLEEPERWPNAVEEVFRYDSPVQVTIREAYRDTDVLGNAVAQGRAVLIFLGAANRDPEVFADPATFDVTRANAHDHLALSAGPHFCLGASLARLEGAVGLQLLYERFPDLMVTGSPTRRSTRVLRGYERLPVSA